MANRRKDPNNEDNVIAVFLGRGVPLGTWTLRLHGDEVKDGGGHFHAWIERDNDNQSRFLPPEGGPQNDNSCTIGSISCGHRTIVVGSYDAHDTGLPLSPGSSSGETRDGRLKPDISAPGHAVLAAYSRTKTALTRKTGTSMAAAAVTGTIALILGEADARGVNLDCDQIRDILIETARKNPPSAPQNGSPTKGEWVAHRWDPRYGYGRVNASAAVAAIAGRSAPLGHASAQEAASKK